MSLFASAPGHHARVLSVPGVLRQHGPDARQLDARLLALFERRELYLGHGPH